MVKEEKETIPKTLKDLNQPRSRAERVKMLLKKNSGLFKDKEAVTDFKEPVGLLMRRGGNVELYEDCSKGVFECKHSDGKQREIYLDPSNLCTADYGKRKFKLYIMHEDYPLPLPENPINTTETMNLMVDNALMDNKKLSMRESEIQMKWVKTAVIAVAILALVYMAYKANIVDRILSMVTGKQAIPPVQPIVENIADKSLDIAAKAWVFITISGRKLRRIFTSPLLFAKTHGGGV